MEEQPISPETAIIAKAKGFNSITKQDVSDSHYSRAGGGKTFSFYVNNEFVTAETNSNLIFGLIANYQGIQTHYEYYLAPTQSVLQKWLREVHNLHICEKIGYGKPTWFSFHVQSISDESIFLDTEDSWSTFEEALEQSLINALNLITT